MDWNSILTFASGALVALIPTIINNRFQSKEKEKDRLEQRRDARIQAKEKWIERDILRVMDSIETTLKLLSRTSSNKIQLEHILDGKISGLLTQEESDEKLRSLYNDLMAAYIEVNQAKDVISRIVYSFEDTEINTTYDNFVVAFSNYLRQEREYMDDKFSDKTTGEYEEGNWFNVSNSAGKFHKTLREKLISLREN